MSYTALSGGTFWEVLEWILQLKPILMSIQKLAVLNYSDFSIQHNLINLDRLEDRTIDLRIESLRSYP